MLIRTFLQMRKVRMKDKIQHTQLANASMESQSLANDIP